MINKKIFLLLLGMIKSIALYFFLAISISVVAQAGKTNVIETAEQIKTLYNQKKFSEIYVMASPNFKKQLSEKALTDFFSKSIFSAFAEMESNEYISKEKNYHSFVSHFKKGELRMNISLNDSNQIETLQFAPYQSPPKFKVLNYLSDNKKQTSLDTLIDKTVTDYMQSPQNCGLSIGVYQNGKEFFYNYGEVKRNSKTLPNQNTIYEIGSISKTFCGILLAKAIEEKKVKATDDIRLYLPKEKYDNLKKREQFIQLIHLANHTSGLPRIPDDLQNQPNYDSLNPYKNYNKQMMFNYLKRVSLVSQPGKVCEYSNFGMALLGIILEKVYNKTFEELIVEKICKANNMTNTTINLNAEQTKKFTTGYNAVGNETPHWNLGDIAAAGGIRSTVSDMLIYLKQNMEEKDEAIKLSHWPTFTNGNNIGMAWHIIKTKQGNTLIWHNGATYGYSSFCGFIKEKNCTIVVLSNSGMFVDPISIAVLKYLQQ